MESSEIRLAVWDIRFETEVADGLLDPEFRLGGRSRADAQRHDAGSIKRQWRERFKPGDAAAELANQPGSLIIVGDGDIPEPAQMASPGQTEGVGVAGRAFDRILGPFEPGAAAGGFQVRTVRAGGTGAVLARRRVKQAAVDLRVRLESGVEAGQLSQDIALPSRRLRRERAIPIRLGGRSGTVGEGVIIAAMMDAEQDINQRSAQLANSDMRLAPEVNGLQQFEEPLSRVVARGFVRGQIAGAEDPRGAEDLATFLR